MDLALQRSSCDYDPYKERLFIYMREQPIVSFDASACGNNFTCSPVTHLWHYS
jgi:gamma-tubulin complex component 6